MPHLAVTTRSDLLFVYGTLMRGFPLHPVLAAGAVFVAPAAVPARLIDLGRYPAAVPDATGSVAGELYRVLDPVSWARLDSVEGARYHRGEARVCLAGGREAVAQIYWYVGPLAHGVPIPGGDYRAHAPARSVHRPHD